MENPATKAQMNRDSQLTLWNMLLSSVRLHKLGFMRGGYDSKIPFFALSSDSSQYI